MVQESWHYLPSPVLRKRHKGQLANSGCSPTPKKARHGEQSTVQHRSGHSSASASQSALLTLALMWVPLTLVPDELALEGQHGTNTIAALSTMEAFAAARDQLALSISPLLAVQESAASV